MPPLPELRCSPGREQNTENSHMRGKFEGGLIHKTKDDDLLLFNEVKKQEGDNFLLHTADDFDDSLSKLRNLSDFKLGINIQTSGETSDLLNGEGDKNDYDWLLTPPDTPLFPKLDDDDSQPGNLARSGRTRSQPIPISRSVSDKSFQTSRTSYSPKRLSPSPRSNDTLAQVRGRSSSAAQSSPSPVIRSTTPTRSPNSSPNKPPTPPTRSATPTLPRTSTNFSIQASNIGGRGASLVNAAHGNYYLPKLQGWQKTFPDFNSEAPPKMQTSLLDPSISYSRASSPASRYGRELSTKFGRKSISPTSSRGISTLHSPEKDHISSYFKGFKESSGDDDEEFLHSRTVEVSRSLPHRKYGALANNKAMSFSRKPSNISPSKPAPKRSFDSALRLDQRKTPQNMFRPLMSSVPATTFLPNYSRNSSLTTSSNTSSEQGTVSVASGLEGIEIEQNDLPGGLVRTEDLDTNEEVFLFNKVDEIIGDTRDEALSGKNQTLDGDFTEILRNKFNSKDIQNAIVSIGDVTSIRTFESAQYSGNQCVIDGHANMDVCSKCGQEFNIDKTSQNQNLCDQCTQVYMFCTAEIAFNCVSLTENVQSHVDTAVNEGRQEGHLNGGVPEFYEDDIRKVKLCQRERNTKLGADLSLNNFLMQLLNHNESQPSDHQQLDMKKNLKVDVPEGAGISLLLLQESASTKWPILQGKTLSATNIFCSEPSYSINDFNALRRSIGVTSASATSSIDLGLPRQTETYFQLQLSRKNEAHVIIQDIDSNSQCIGSDKDASTHSYERRDIRSEINDIFSSSTECLECDSSRDMITVYEKHTEYLDQSNLISTSSSQLDISEECRSVPTDDFRTVSTTESLDLSHQSNNDLLCSSTAEIMFEEKCSSSINTDEVQQDNESNVRSIERTSDISICFEMVEDQIMVNHTSKNVILDAAIDSSSIVAFESQDGCCEFENRPNEFMSSHDPPSSEYSNEHSLSQTSEIDTSLCSSELISAVLETGESAIIVEGPSGRLTRSLTLEEATNTIIFCSSIIHDLACKATTIAMEKQQEVLSEHQAPLPITVLEKSFPVPREESGKLSNKHFIPRSQEFKQKKSETQPKSPLREAENVIVEEFPISKNEFPEKLDSEKPPKLGSKCNCSIL